MGRKTDKTKEIIETAVKVAGTVAAVGGVVLGLMNGDKKNNPS